MARRLALDAKYVFPAFEDVWYHLWRERKLPTVIGRLFNTVGPRQSARYGMVLPRFVAAAMSETCRRET